MGDSEALGSELRRAVQDASAMLTAAAAAATARKPAPGKWCAREVLGHLIDSAANNHRRFVLGQTDPAQSFDGYAQVEWVARGRYETADWDHLVALWSAYNLHLARVIEGMSEEALRSERLRFVVDDYIRHLRHHLAQIRALVAG